MSHISDGKSASKEEIVERITHNSDNPPQVTLSSVAQATLLLMSSSTSASVKIT